MGKLRFILFFVLAMTIGHLVTRQILQPGFLYLIFAPAIGLFVYVIVSFIYYRIRLGEAGMQKLIDEGNQKVEDNRRTLDGE